MTTHDDLLHAAALAQAEHPGELEYLFAEKMLAAVEPIIRADERERILSELEGPARESEAMYAHAEQVAARLVEVICEDAESEAWLEESNQQLQGQITQLIQNGYRLRRERDAARAERLEALQKVATLDDQLAAARAEIAALHEWHPQSAVGALRMMRAEQVLADLRAKVEALGDPRDEWDAAEKFAAVLALLDEGEQP